MVAVKKSVPVKIAVRAPVPFSFADVVSRQMPVVGSGNGLVLGILSMIDTERYPATGVSLALLPTHYVELKSMDKLLTRKFWFHYTPSYKARANITLNEAVANEAVLAAMVTLLQAQDKDLGLCGDYLEHYTLEPLAGGIGLRYSDIGLDSGFFLAPHLLGMRPTIETSVATAKDAPVVTAINLNGQAVDVKNLTRLEWSAVDYTQVTVDIDDCDAELGIDSRFILSSPKRVEDSELEVVISIGNGAAVLKRYLSSYTPSAVKLSQIDTVELHKAIVKGVRALNPKINRHLTLDFANATVKFNELVKAAS